MGAVQGTIHFTESQCLRVRTHLQTVLDNPAFAGSRRRQAFLRYVVEETLADRGHAIKETNIAVDVFERSSDFDAQSASVVRVTGGEVRKRLAQLYSSGLEADVRIELPLGSYQPLIQLLPSEPQPAADSPLAPSPVLVAESPGKPRWRPFHLLVVGAAVAVTSVFAAGYFWPKPPIERLWQPFLRQERPVLIYLVAPTLLAVSEPAKWLPLRDGQSIPNQYLQEMESTYVGTGGAVGAALFAEHLAARNQRFVLKFGNDLSFADLKNSPTILVGASRWTRELNQNFRFRMIAEDDMLKIVDDQNPGQSWAIPTRHREDRLEGFALVTRLLRSESGQPAMMVVGMDARNTMAAVEFLTRGDKFDQFAASAPAGWENRSFQIVLRNKIHGNSSGSLEIVATHLW